MRKKDDSHDKISKLMPTALPNCINGVHIELVSNNEAVIEGIKGVIEYDETFVKLNVGKGTVEFWGTGLEILSLDLTELCIKGNISRVEFCV